MNNGSTINRGVSVTKRISDIKQPRGGYLKPSLFETTVLEDKNLLNEKENINPSLVGLVVDYMTRFLMGTNIEDAFIISLKGAKRSEIFTKQDNLAVAVGLLINIKDLDDKSIINACKLVTFDVWFRNPMAAINAIKYNEVLPDKETVDNIRIMINRSLYFFNLYGPITKDGFDFAPVNSTENQMIKSGEGTYGGYTSVVSSGDGDFLTKDTLWDFKVSKSKPTSHNTLQILMYWIMGQHSGQDCYKGIDKIGIFNPRLNIVYRYNIENLPKETIELIEKKVICY